MLKEFERIFDVHRISDDNIYSALLYDNVELDYYANYDGISISFKIKYEWIALIEKSFMATNIRLQKLKELHEILYGTF